MKGPTEFDADKLEQTRKSYFNPHFISTLYSFLELKDNFKSLDVGCGTGYYCRLIAPKIKKGKIIGIDIDNKLIKRAKELTKESYVNYEIGDVYNLEFEDNSFDLVWCQTVLCNLDKPNKALQEMIRVSKNKVIALEPCNSKNIEYFGSNKETVEYYNLVKKIMSKIECRISGDFDIGSKLPVLFYKHKLKNIDVLAYGITDMYKGEAKIDNDFIEIAKNLVPKQITQREFSMLKNYKTNPPLGSLNTTPIFIVKGDKY